VPHARHPELRHRPDYFAAFDRWLQQLEAHIPDPAIRAAVLTTLDEDGRQVDVQQLAARHRLDRQTVRLIRNLVRFGDVGHPVHSFGSICLAEIAPRAGQRIESVATYVYATRRGAKIDFWWADSAEGFGALGVRDRPLTLREAVVMVARVVGAQARYDVIDGGDRSAYAPKRTSQLRIGSTFYRQLGAWFRASRRRRAQRTGRTRG
jgi:hypothetical protein